jgi:aminoglycoside phosphotransferase (APT) family kinase protein
MTTIPSNTDELTPAWFGEVLETEVRSVELADAHSGTTGRALVRIDGDDLPDTLFVKLQPFPEEQRSFLRMTGLGVAEARFYAGATSLPVRAPRSWYAAHDDETGSFIMVLEDLVAAGCRFATPEDDDVLAVAESLMEELAALHATYWEQDIPWLGTHSLTSGGGDEQKQRAAGGAALVQSAIDQFAADLPPAFGELGALYTERYLEVGRLFNEGPRTLIHGDDHIGNLFVEDGRTGFYDWAVASRYPGMRDVAYFLCNSLPTELRRDEEASLIGRYRQGLADRGITLDERTAWDQYRLFATYSWISASTTAAMGSRLQPFEIGYRATVRTTDAIIDLDTIGLLKERLG